jgi:putative alpha-1,2-mannosidase
LIDLLFPTEVWYSYSIKDAEIRKVNDYEIEGYATCQIRAHDWNVYTLNFVLKFSKPFETFNAWNEGKLLKDTTAIKGKNDAGAYVTYQTKKGDVVMVKSGLSLVSIEQARLNLETEMGDLGWDFDSVRKTASNTWNDLLGSVKVEGGTDEDKTKFYTNLYRCYAAKQTWSDVNGRYMDPCEQVLEMPEGQRMIGGDSFWNSYWNLNRVWSLISPEYMESYVQAQLELYRKNGWTSVGPTGVEYTGIMKVSHETAMITGAYQKGIRNFDVEEAYRAVHHTVTEQGRKLEPCSGLAGNEFLNIYMSSV